MLDENKFLNFFPYFPFTLHNRKVRETQHSIDIYMLPQSSLEEPIALLMAQPAAPFVLKAWGKGEIASFHICGLLASWVLEGPEGAIPESYQALQHCGLLTQTKDHWVLTELGRTIGQMTLERTPKSLIKLVSSHRKESSTR